MFGFNIFLPGNKIIARLPSGTITIAISIINKDSLPKGDIVVFGRDGLTGERFTWINTVLGTSDIIIAPLNDSTDYSKFLSTPSSSETGMTVNVSGESYLKILSKGIVGTVISSYGDTGHLFFGMQNLAGEQIPPNVSFDLGRDNIVHVSLTI